MKNCVQFTSLLLTLSSHAALFSENYQDEINARSNVVVVTSVIKNKLKQLYHGGFDGGLGGSEFMSINVDGLFKGYWLLPIQDSRIITIDGQIAQPSRRPDKEVVALVSGALEFKPGDGPIVLGFLPDLVLGFYKWEQPLKYVPGQLSGLPLPESIVLIDSAQKRCAVWCSWKGWSRIIPIDELGTSLTRKLLTGNNNEK